MMRALAFILCFLAFGAHAQIVGDGMGAAYGGTKASGGSYSGPLDAYSTGVVSCYLSIACGSTQAGGTTAWANVSRSSDSYTETCDILLNTSGLPGNTSNCSGSSNGTGIQTWCAAGGAGTCQGNSLYDQLHGTTTNKLTFNGGHPQLTFTCFGGSQACWATGVSSYSSMETASYTGTASTYSHMAVFEAVSDTSSEGYVVSSTSGYCCSGLGVIPNGTIQAFLYAGGTSQATGLSLNTLYNAAAIVNGSSSKIVLNGSVNALATPGTNALGASFGLGSGGAGGNYPFKGYYAGAITFNAPLATGSGQPTCLLLNSLAGKFGGSITGC
jgi:hypothetical protein